jgi:hypothetical protein
VTPYGDLNEVLAELVDGARAAVGETMAFAEYACGREDSNLQGPKSTGT